MEASGNEAARGSQNNTTPVTNVEEDLNEQVNDVDDQTADQDTKEGGTRLRSFVWDHFTKLPGNKRAQCTHCKGTLASASKGNGTTALRNHLRLHCRQSPLYKKVDKSKQTTLAMKPKGSGEGSGTVTPYKFSQEKCKNFFARMCIRDNRPFSMADDPGFQAFVWELNPLFKFPSRYTIARECHKIYEEEKKALKALLCDQMVSLTTDTWTSVQNLNYMCLTAHWIDDDWILRKKILNFCLISNHKAETIGKLVYRCLQEWGIDRVFTVTVDNASSNDGAIKYLQRMLKGPQSIMEGRFMHLRCSAHILNLIVKDGLQEHFSSICKIRNAVRYTRSSSSRFDKFKICVEKEEIECKKKPCLDVETRWNSTFLMLETAIKFEKAFGRLKDVESSYRSYFVAEAAVVDEGSTRMSKKRKKSARVEGAPDTNDFEKARQFMEFLRIFFNVTKKISGSKYNTASLLFDEISKMHLSIKKMSKSVDEKQRAMAKSMMAKFEKYWDSLDNINLLLYVALVLDPRSKMTYLGFCVSLIYGVGHKKIEEIQELVRLTMLDLFDDYKKKLDKSTEPPSSSTTNIVDDDEAVDLELSYKKYLEQQGRSQVVSNEVEIYLKDGMEIRKDDFDVLGWWKINSLKFPILSQIAKHVLAMPITTVASESAFSTGGRVIDKYRSSLTPKTAEALICSQDWLNSKPLDLQEFEMHGEELEDMVENLEKIEEDMPKGKKPRKDSTFEDDEDWE